MDWPKSGLRVIVTPQVSVCSSGQFLIVVAISDQCIIAKLPWDRFRIRSAARTSSANHNDCDKEPLETSFGALVAVLLPVNPFASTGEDRIPARCAVLSVSTFLSRLKKSVAARLFAGAGRGIALEPFPEEIKRFLDANIDTVEQLEILRVLHGTPDKEWSALALVREIQASPQAIVAHLNALHGRGLLTLVSRGSDLLYRKGARSPELGQSLDRLLELYGQRPVTMINMVYARSREMLQTFANAFRIRKDN